MAFNGNYINIETVISDLEGYPFIEKISKRDASHKLVKLLSIAEIALPLEKMVANIEIKIHKGVLPKDIMHIRGVNNKGNSCSNKGIPMNYSSDINHSSSHFKELKNIACGTNITSATQISKIYPPTLSDTATNLNGLLWGSTSFAPIKKVADIPLGITENSYTINGMSIDTSFAYGWVELLYDSVKVDDNGFPMIPDQGSFKEAFKYYLLKSYAESAFYRGDVPRHVYVDIETQYTWYIGQAMNNFAMLSPDQAETMTNRLVRIIPRSTGSRLN